MKTLNERLDHVLRTLVENGDVICLMYFTKFNSSAPQENEFGTTKEYDKLFKPLGLNNGQFIEVLDILKENRYVEYDILKPKEQILDVPLTQHIWFKNLITGSITDESSHLPGYNYLLLQGTVHLGQCQKVQITLKGKFYFEQGGFQGEENEKSKEKNRSKKQDEQIRLLTLFLAIGSIGVLIIEAMKFLLDYF